MSKQDGFEEKSRELAERLDSEDLVCPNDNCPKCSANIGAIASALRAAHNEALEECAETTIELCSSNYMRRGADWGHELADELRSLKSPEGGGL